MKRAHLLAHAFAFAIALAPRLRAQPADIGSPIAFAPTPGTQSNGDGAERSYWALAGPRFFFAASLEIGFAYARPKLSAGRGRPHWEWVGIEAVPLATPEGVGAYAGLRGQVPNLDLRAGLRHFAPFSRSLIAIEDDYERADIERSDGPSGNYTALETELAAHLPAPSGNVFALFTGYYIPDRPPGHHLYEESLRVVIAPPFVWRARLGYAFHAGPDDELRIGPAAEVLGLPGRDAHVYRAGIVAVAPLSATLDVQLSFLPVISSPDSIGLAGADFTQFGVRWRWATGAPPR